jgi:hypothetical protein
MILRRKTETKLMKISNGEDEEKCHDVEAESM